jgi:4-amino-4-deoxy-L-arabinose transferase-like glycosyltransferase
MYDKKITIIAVGAVVFALLGGSLWANTVEARFSGQDHDSFVEKLSQRFNLNQEDVKTFFEEIKQEEHEKRKAKSQARFDQAIKNGELTLAEVELILDKREELHQEWQAKREDFKDLSGEEKKELLKNKKQSIMDKKQQLLDWAEENEIDLKYLMPHKGHKYGNFKKFHKGGGGRD